jgi:hypothetical protein
MWFCKHLWQIKNRSGKKERFMCLFSCIGEQRYMTCSLDSQGYLALMLGTITGNSSGKNLASLGNVFSEFENIFIINVVNLVHAKSTYALARPSASLSSLCFSHALNLLSS